MKFDWEDCYEAFCCLQGICLYLGCDPLEAEKADGLRRVLEEKERHRKEFQDYLRCRNAIQE